MKKRTARVIITKACQRNCSYCCNEYDGIMASARTITSLDALKEYEEICITGGEPMLMPARTRTIIEQLLKLNPNVTIYLYTAKYDERIVTILPLIHGVHFTLHTGATKKDIVEFMEFQSVIGKHQEGKSFRLYVSPDITQPVMIRPSHWARVQVKPWIQEGALCLPENEDLLILEDALCNIK
jgi:organic radical activating enzyme